MTHQQTYSYPPTDPDQPDRVTSEPVPVPSPAATEDRDETDTTAAADTPEDVTDRVPEETLDDQGTFEDPVLSEDRTDPDDLTAVTPSQDDDVADEDAPRDSAEDSAAIADTDERVTDAEPQAEMLPGDVPAEPVTALWGEDTAQSFRDRWRDVQLRFVDDPQGAARDAQSLVDDAVQSLTTALTGQRDQLGEWTSTDGADTEHFRVAVRQYRDFLDRLLGL